MRKRRMRQELQDTGILVNEYNVEIARLTLNNLVVINQAEMYFTILNETQSRGVCTINRLNKIFGYSGTYGSDPAVMGALLDLADLKLISILPNLEDARYVNPLATPQTALARIKPYTNHYDAIAGMEPIDE